MRNGAGCDKDYITISQKMLSSALSGLQPIRRTRR